MKKRIGRCSGCLEMCEAIYDNGYERLPDLAHVGRERRIKVRKPGWYSNCCYEEVIFEDSCDERV